MEKDKFVILSKDVANAIFSYLGKKPYSEVAEIIGGMMGDINQNAVTLDIVSKEAQPAPDAKQEVKQPVEETK